MNPGGVLILNTEDGSGDTVRPRLDSANADCDRVLLWDWESALPRFPHDADWLSERLVEHDVKLVVLDTLNCFLDASVDGHKDQDVRRALTPLVKAAGRSGAAILAIRHLNKSQQSSAMYRGMGSMAFAGLARAVWMAGRPPQGDGMVLAPVKSNLGQAPRSIRYSVTGKHGFPVISWEGQCDVEADDLVAQPDSTPQALPAAVEWLERTLIGTELRTTDVEQRALDEGITKATLRRARDKLGVVSKKRENCTWMSLPT